ncbi:MAG: GNAT family N-acetyltransferase [Methanocalculus sp.]|uniref:GNAT family N-acetyltransferase n=1 Tax=Methanocalculus sp. TaxID=2004547 RepID=UPI00271B2E24|nr:GNAT family N-acetyltransferase [Methanocalculus sp.]MDO9538552.1 GNAT family N-acetyltransferase [Methanocalculus sp.]
MNERIPGGRKQAICLRIVREWDTNDIVKLYKSAGWWKDEWNQSVIPALIRGSHRFVVAIDEITGSAIGMGRTISDGVSDAYIQDVVVLKEYRRCYIGIQIVELLTRLCAEDGIIWIGLISEPGTLPFYKKIGFEPMEQYIPMIYQKGDNNALSP